MSVSTQKIYVNYEWCTLVEALEWIMKQIRIEERTWENNDFDLTKIWDWRHFYEKDRFHKLDWYIWKNRKWDAIVAWYFVEVF